MKLFEIPIYAFSRTELKKRIKKWKKKYNEKESEMLMNERKQYDYNHIVGFIVINYKDCDITGALYLPHLLSHFMVKGTEGVLEEDAYKRKYIWHSSRKTFIEKMDINGAGFFGDNLQNHEIVQIIDDLLAMIQESVYGYNKKYYIDYEVYNNTKNCIDYTNLFSIDNFE